MTTDNTGKFTVTRRPLLPEGFQRAQVVVVGQADQPPLPGLSSAQQHAFRTDQTPPSSPESASHWRSDAADHQPARFRTSRSTSDPVNPSMSRPVRHYLATPLQVLFPAIDPSTASNVSNYSLILINPNGTTTDESQFITSATFAATARPSIRPTPTSSPTTG